METIQERYENYKEDVKDDEKSFLQAIEQLEEAQKWKVKMELNLSKSRIKLLEFVIENNITYE